MKALVTGASGFIGSHVARVLRDAGMQVRVLRRPTSDLSRVRDLGVEEVVGDLRDPGSLGYCLQGCDLLFHVGALYSLRWADRHDIIRTNVEGTRHLLAAALEEGIERVVFTSSVATIGLRRDGKPSTEMDVARPGRSAGAYKLSKWLSEGLALGYSQRGLDVVVVNPSTPVGWGDVRPTPTGQLLLDFLRGRMPACVDTGLNFVDVEDVARGHLLALERGRTGERYILGNRNMTLAELFRELQDLTGVPAPRLRIPHAAALVAAVADELVLSPLLRRAPVATVVGAMLARKPMYFDASRAVQELGLPQTPVRDALSKAVHWFQGRGYVAPEARAVREGYL